MKRRAAVSLCFLIPFSLTVLLAATSPLANTLTWDDKAHDGNWNNRTNWSTDVVPPNNSSYYAVISMSTGPVVTFGQTVGVYRVLLQGACTGTLTVNGGTLNVGNYVYAADISAARRTLNMNGRNTRIDWLTHTLADADANGVDHKLVFMHQPLFVYDLNEAARRCIEHEVRSLDTLPLKTWSTIRLTKSSLSQRKSNLFISRRKYEISELC
jgi:hypothetical protein